MDYISQQPEEILEKIIGFAGAGRIRLLQVSKLFNRVGYLKPIDYFTEAIIDYHRLVPNQSQLEEIIARRKDNFDIVKVFARWASADKFIPSIPVNLQPGSMYTPPILISPAAQMLGEMMAASPKFAVIALDALLLSSIPFATLITGRPSMKRLRDKRMIMDMFYYALYNVETSGEFADEMKATLELGLAGNYTTIAETVMNAAAIDPDTDYSLPVILAISLFAHDGFYGDDWEGIRQLGKLAKNELMLRAGISNFIEACVETCDEDDLDEFDSDDESYQEYLSDCEANVGYSTD